MRELTCIVCPNGCRIQCEHDDENNTYRITGNRCPRGEQFALAEMINPTRTLTTSVKTAFADHPVVSVRTDRAIPMGMLFRVVDALCDVIVTTRIGIGDVIVANVCGTGANVVCTTNRLKA